MGRRGERAVGGIALVPHDPGRGCKPRHALIRFGWLVRGWTTPPVESGPVTVDRGLRVCRCHSMKFIAGLDRLRTITSIQWWAAGDSNHLPPRWLPRSGLLMSYGRLSKRPVKSGLILGAFSCRG